MKMKTTAAKRSQPVTEWMAAGSMILIIVIASLVSLTPDCLASVVVFDLETFSRFDITDPLRTVSNIGEIDGIVALNVSAQSGDDWLVVEGDGTLQFLAASTLKPMFRISETTLRDLFGLPDGNGWCSSLTPAGRTVDTLLYYDVTTDAWYGIELDTGHAGVFPDMELELPFYSGFAWSSETDIGLLAMDNEGKWHFETLPDRQATDFDPEPLVGGYPDCMGEFRLSSGSATLHLMLAVTTGTAPGTPTPTPGPETPTATPSAAGSYDIVVATGLGETLWRIDPDDYHMDQNVAPTGQSPNQALVHNGELYVVNSLSHSVTVYDPVTLQLKRELSVGIGGNPFWMEFVDNDSFYITQFNANSVSRINVWTGALIREIPMPDDLPVDPGNTTWPRPAGICRVGDTAYIACANLDSGYIAGGPGVVVMIDITTDQVSGWFESGGRNCVGVVYDQRHPDRLWTVNAGDYTPGQGFDRNGTITVFDAGSQSFIHSIQTGDAPMELVFGPQRGYFSSAADGMVGRLDPSGLNLLSSVILPTAGQGLNFVSGLAAGPDHRLWVLEFNHDRTWVLDMNADDALIRELTVGWGPDALAVVLK